MAQESGRESAEHAKSHQAERPAPMGLGLGEIEAQADGPSYSGSLLGDPRLNGRGNGPVKAAVMRQAQRTYGNRAVQRFLHRAGGTAAGSVVQGDALVVQRHPAGATLLPEKETAAGEIEEARSGGSPDAPSPATPSAGGSAVVRTESAASAVGGGPAAPAAAPTAEEGQPTAAPAPAQDRTGGGGSSGGGTSGGGTSGGSTTTTTAPSTRALTLARTQEILQADFGSVHTIVPGTIVTLPDTAATWARYDQVNRGRNNIYVTPNRPWQDGDAQAAFPLGLNGFADAGTVYVNQQTAIETTTPHEMLHMNTASGFRAAVGEEINEGATEYLAMHALTLAGIAMTGGHAYHDEVTFIENLVGLVSHGTLVSAYFGGANTLINAVDSARGRGTFDQIRRLLAARDFRGATRLLEPPRGDFPLPSGDTRYA